MKVGEDDIFLSAKELSERWAGIVAAGTLKNWRSQKKGPKYVKFGRDSNSHVAYRIEDIVAFEKKMTKETKKW